MALVNLSEAARLAGKDRSTIHRKVKDGTLSATVDAAGNKAIDTAELQRVFGALHGAAKQQGTTGADVAPLVGEGASEIVALLKQQVADAEARELWLRQRLDDAEAARKELELRLLPAPAPEPAPRGPDWELRVFALVMVLAVAAIVLWGAR